MSNHHEPSDTFVAIDVEWATRDQMICQVGLAVVRNGEIAQHHMWRIQPPGNVYDESLRLNHHITPEQTATAPTLEEAWPEIQPYLLMGELWAHNAVSAEIPAFRKSLAEYNMSAEWLDIRDSRELFRRNDCDGGNGLRQCCMAMDIPFDETEHHDALYDAEQLAELLIRYAEGYRPKWDNVPMNAEQLRKAGQAKLTLTMGKFAAHNKLQEEQKKAGLVGDKIDLFAELASSCDGAQPQIVDVFDKGDRMPKDGQDIIDYARLDMGESSALYKKVVAMTGFFHISRKEIERALKTIGATIDGMTKSTDVLLVGSKNVGLPKLAKYEKQLANRNVALVVGDADLDALLYGDGHKFFKPINLSEL